MNQSYKYHYFYRIENLINGNYYYGIHSTNNLNDRYMGSGSRLKMAYKLYGKENFKKTILQFFETRELASVYESEVVNETCVKDINCYNLKQGGDYGTTVGTIIVRDKDDKLLRVKPTDEEYLNGTVVPILKDRVYAFDTYESKYEIISKEDFRKSDRYVGVTKGKIVAKDKDGNYKLIPLDSAEYLSGEYKPIWCGRHHTAETKMKMSKTKKEQQMQEGYINPLCYTCWVNNGECTIKIKKEDLDYYINNGWKNGRIIKNMKKNFKLNDSHVDIIVQYRKDGLSWDEISKRLNIDRSTLLRYRKRYNIEI